MTGGAGGGAPFPGLVPLLLLVLMAGDLISATLLYRFPGFAGYDTRLAARYPDQLARLPIHLTKPRAIWFVALGAFFPVTPTDLVYAAGLVRMPYGRVLSGVIFGKFPLVIASVLAGRQVAGLLLP